MFLSKSLKACAEKANGSRKSWIAFKVANLCQSEMETTAAEPGQGWLCMCLCPGGLKNKEEARRASRPWEQKKTAAVKMSQALSVSLGTREENWVGSGGFTSQRFVQSLPWCYGSRRIAAIPSQQGTDSKASKENRGHVPP